MYKEGLLFVAVCLAVAIAKSTCPLPLDLDPVCGSDGQTYENICTLVRARSLEPNLELLSEGPCEEDNPQEEEEGQDAEDQVMPSCDCPQDNDPVCGSDGNTYDNPCMLDCARRENSLLEMVKARACEEKAKAAQNPRDQSCECSLEKAEVGDEINMDELPICCANIEDISIPSPPKIV